MGLSFAVQNSWPRIPREQANLSNPIPSGELLTPVGYGLGLTKNFRVCDRVRVQVRIEALNATNYTLKPRDIQIGARVTF